MKVMNAGSYFWVDIKKPVCIKAQQNHNSHVSKIFNISIKVKIRLIKQTVKFLWSKFYEFMQFWYIIIL